MKSIQTSKSLTLNIEGRLFTIGLKDPRMKKVRRLIEQRKKSELVQLLDAGTQIAEATNGRIKLDRGQVLVDGRPANPVLTERIQNTSVEMGGPEAIMKFTERMLENPSQRSADQAWRFLKHHHLPLLPNGHVLAYKGIRADWTDCHSGRVKYRLGEKTTIPRDAAINNPKEHCAPGLHAGTLEFAKSYGKILIEVSIDPFDIVSVPEDANGQKIRTCALTPIRVHTGVETHQNLIEKALVNTEAPKAKFTIPFSTINKLMKICEFTEQKLHGRNPRTQIAFDTHLAGLKAVTGLNKRELERLIFSVRHRQTLKTLCRIRRSHHS